MGGLRLGLEPWRRQVASIQPTSIRSVEESHRSEFDAIVEGLDRSLQALSTTLDQESNLAVARWARLRKESAHATNRLVARGT